MKTVGEVLALSKEYVLSHAHGRPKHEIESFLADILRLPSRLDLYVNYDKPLQEAELEKIRPGLRRLAKGEPLAYILGYQSFYGHEFTVSSSVLIPRPETEFLVERALKIIDSSFSHGSEYALLDCCAGSGCVGLTIKKERPHINVTLSDISVEALEISKLNAARLGVVVNIKMSDLLDEALLAGRRYSMVVSNPPYLTENEWIEADYSVRNFEPKIALTGGNSGVAFYERFVQDLPSVLSPQGWFLCEIGSSQGNFVSGLLQDAGFGCVEIICDFQGHDRVVVGKLA